MSTSVLVQSPWCLRQWAASFAQPFGWRKTYENMIRIDNIKTFKKLFLWWCIFTFDLCKYYGNCFANCKSYFPWIQFRSNWNTIDFVFCPRLQICIWAEKKNKATFYSLLQSISDCQNWWLQLTLHLIFSQILITIEILEKFFKKTWFALYWFLSFKLKCPCYWE